MIHPPTETILKEMPAAPAPIAEKDSDKKEAERKWREAFAGTTEEELDHLEQIFVEEEAKHGTTPLDFKKR